MKLHLEAHWENLDPEPIQLLTELKLIFLLLDSSKPQLSEQSGLAVFASDWSYLPPTQAAAGP